MIPQNLRLKFLRTIQNRDLANLKGRCAGLSRQSMLHVLHLCAIKNFSDGVKYLVETALKDERFDLEAPYLLAVEHNSRAVIAYFEEEWWLRPGLAALKLAIERVYVRMVERFLSSQRYSRRDLGLALVHAVMHDRPRMCKMLIKYGAPVNFRGGEPLRCAQQYRMREVAAVLSKAAAAGTPG